MKNFDYKKYILRTGIPILVSFLFMTFVVDSIILPLIFNATDSGNFNLFVWIVIDTIILFSIFFATRYILFILGLIDTWRGKIPKI